MAAVEQYYLFTSRDGKIYVTIYNSKEELEKDLLSLTSNAFESHQRVIYKGLIHPVTPHYTIELTSDNDE